jgi:hypothetical protein
MKKITISAFALLLLMVAAPTQAAQMNPAACNASVTRSSGETGTYACYGVDSKNALFQIEKDNVCLVKNKPATGCVIKAPVCKSGQAVAVEYYNISDPSVFTWNLYKGLNITEAQLTQSVNSVWQYMCSDGLKKVSGNKVELLLDGKKAQSSVKLDTSKGNITVAVQTSLLQCVTDIMYGQKLFSDTRKFLYLSPSNEYGILKSLKTSCTSGRKKMKDTVSFTSVTPSTVSTKDTFTVKVNGVTEVTIKNIKYDAATTECAKAYHTYFSRTGDDVLECYYGATLMRKVTDWPG